MFVQELSFPQTAPTDDAFFNRNWAGACGGRLAGPGLLAGWISTMLKCRLQTWYSSAKTRMMGGRRGLRPWLLRCLNQILPERKDGML